MNPRTVNIILRKEMLDTLRDKRTLIMMIVVPVLLYPLMLLVSTQLMLVHHNTLEKTVSRVAVLGPEPELLKSWLRELPRVEIIDSTNPEKDLAAGKLDAVVVAECGISEILDADGAVPITIEFDSTEFSSRDALGRLKNALEDIAYQMQLDRMDRAGLTEDYIQPFKINRSDMAPPAKTTGMLLGLILPVLMITMIALGAFYPAVDLTAGEKERGTFETLLSTPVAKIDIVAGKFLTIFLLAMLTGLLNLASMALSFLVLIAQLSSSVQQELPFAIQLPFWAFLVMTFVMIPLAFFISAMMMSVAIFARSFKEAQNYLTPLMMLILFPAMFGGFPGASLGTFTQFIPVANVVLLFREIMTGKAGVEQVFFVSLSSAVYAILSLLLATWLFQREEVVLSEQGGIPLSLRRSDFRPRETLTPGGAMLLLCLEMLLLFYLASLAQQWKPLAGILITQWALILVPVVALLWFARVNLRKALSLARPSWAAWTGTICLTASSLLIIIEIGALQNKVLPVSQDLENAFKTLFDFGDSWTGLFYLLFVIAVSPAVCEEILFRGAVMSGLRPRLGTWGTIVAVGVLFGLFHLNLQRILPTGLLGFVLTYLAIRSGSIFPAMLMHFIVNGATVLLSTCYYPKIIDRLINLETIEKQGVPPWLLAVALCLFALGGFLIEAQYRRRRTLPESLSPIPRSATSAPMSDAGESPPTPPNHSA